MAAITPVEGRELVADKLLSDDTFDDWEAFQMAVGTGTAAVSSGDTQLDNEIYRADADDSIVSIADSSADGVVTARIQISGGTEVPADTDLTEFALFAVDPADAPPTGMNAATEDAKDIMLHRESRNAITIGAGDRKTFQIDYEVLTR